MKRIIILICILHTSFMVTRSENDFSQSISQVQSCSELIYDNIVDCVTFLSKGSKSIKPEVSCCSGFETVLNTNADCLFVAIKDCDKLGISLNFTRTMALPFTCGILSTPLLHCDALMSPTITSVSVSPPNLSPEIAPPTPSPKSSPPPPENAPSTPSPKSSPPPDNALPTPSPKSSPLPPKNAPAPKSPKPSTPVPPSSKTPAPKSAPAPKSPKPSTPVPPSSKTPAPAPSPDSGTYSTTISFAVLISMLIASFSCMAV